MPVTIGVQTPERIGDTVWAAWGLTGIARLEMQSRTFCQLDVPTSYLLDESIVDTTAQFPAHFDYSIGFRGDSKVLPLGLQQLPIPPVQFYRSRNVQSVEDTCHFRETGCKHVIAVIEDSLCKGLNGYSLPLLPIMPNCTNLDPGLAQGIKAGMPLVSINVGAYRQERLYPLDKWLEVAAGLCRRGCAIAFIGRDINHESWKSLFSSREQRENPHIFDFVYKTELDQSIAIIARSTVHLSTDTGSGHIASSYDVPTITLFGQMSIADVCRPYGNKSNVIQGDKWTPSEIAPSRITDLALEVIKT